MEFNFYTLHCPKCEVIKRLLKEKGIDFEEIDDNTIIEAIAKKNNTDSIPFAIIDNEFYNTKQLQAWVKEK